MRPIDIPTVRHWLDDADTALEFLRSLGVADLRRAHAALVNIASAGVTLDLMALICDQLAQALPRCADPDMALNNLDRFVAQARSPLSMGTLFERDPAALPSLVQIFSTSQHFSDLLIADPEGFDLLRLTEGSPVARQMLVEDLVAEISALEHDPSVLRSLRRFKRRETLRIAYGDIIREQSLQTVTAQISYLADAILEGALRAAGRKLGVQRGNPIGPDGRPARFVVLGMGKLGGCELNYSSDIDLIFLYDGDGKTDGPRPVSNHEFFDHLAREIVRLLTENTELGIAYRVDLRLRPDGQRGPMVMAPARHAQLLRRSRADLGAAGLYQGPAGGGRSGAGQPVPRAAFALDLSPLPEPGRHRRHQGPQAADRADRPRRRPGPRRQGRARRHSRHRVRDPVPAIAQRRRPAAASHRQHAWRP